MAKIRGIIIFLMLSFVLMLGIWIGTKLNYSENKKQQQYKDNIQSTIAVVNEDMGALNKGIVENYSASVINKLDNGFVLVSSEAAQAGFDKGIYGSIVSFPTNLSQKVVAINSKQPEKVNLDFVISQNLPEDKYIESYKKIIDLQYQVNQMLSYTYVYSIYTELHEAQDQVNSIFQNDNDDMTAVDKVKLKKFTEDLNLGDIPNPEFKPETLDFNDFVENVRGYANDISKAYTDSYDKAKQDYDVYGKEMISLTETLSDKSYEWSNNMQTWQTNVLDYDNKVDDLLKRLIDWQNTANTWKQNNQNWYDNLGKYKEDMLKLKDSADEFRNQSQDFVNKSVKWKNDAKAWSNSILQSQLSRESAVKDALNKYNDNYQSMNQLKTALNKWKTDLEAYDPAKGGPVPQLILPNGFKDPDNLKPLEEWKTDTFNNCPTISNDNLTAFNDTIVTPPDFIGSKDLPEMATAPEKPEIKIPEKPEEIQNSVTDMSEQVYKYNPQNYLTPEIMKTIDDYVYKYSDNIYIVKDKMDKNVENNEKKLSDTYGYYNKYVSDLKTSAIGCNNKEQDNLNKALNIFYTAKNDTSNENKQLLGFFSSMMPNSRIQSVLNKNVVEFTVDPVNFVDTSIRTSQEVLNTSERFISLTQKAMIIIFILICISLIIMLIKFLKTKRVKDDLDLEEF